MNKKELDKICWKHGYKLTKVTHFKNHDRVTVIDPELRITINLRKHLEETPKEGILRAILTNEQLASEGIEA